MFYLPLVPVAFIQHGKNRNNPMNTAEILFWIFFTIVLYTFFGYGIIVFILVKIKHAIWPKKVAYDATFLPDITLIVPSYNEADFILEKVENSKSLDYPKDKLHILFITDGSDDGTYEKIKDIEGITVMHTPERGGKSGAMNRAMKEVTTEFVVFCDANTILNTEALREIVKHYQDPKTGAVACEKRIIQKDKENASSAGEGLYWKYESFLKKYDSDLYTTAGAAGELMSCRTNLYQHLEPDTLLDDFMLTMRIAEKGYRIVYEPQAYAMETASMSVKEELKRKVRICAGGWQSIMRLGNLLNPFYNLPLWFIYVSRKVLRWSLTPLCMLLLLPLNILLVLDGNIFYILLLLGQIAFYSAAALGWYFENKKMKFKAFFVPYYFFIMNYSVFAGFIRFIRKRQSVRWERAKRA